MLLTRRRRRRWIGRSIRAGTVCAPADRGWHRPDTVRRCSTTRGESFRARVRARSHRAHVAVRVSCARQPARARSCRGTCARAAPGRAALRPGRWSAPSCMSNAVRRTPAAALPQLAKRDGERSRERQLNIDRHTDGVPPAAAPRSGGSGHGQPISSARSTRSRRDLPRRRAQRHRPLAITAPAPARSA